MADHRTAIPQRAGLRPVKYFRQGQTLSSVSAYLPPSIPGFRSRPSDYLLKRRISIIFPGKGIKTGAGHLRNADVGCINGAWVP